MLHYVTLGTLGFVQLLWLAMFLGMLKDRSDKRWWLGTDSGDGAPDVSDTLVSVIIPARNEEGSIGKAVTSVLAQDHRNLELIVLNDASEDGTGAEARDAGKGDTRLTVIDGDGLIDGWMGKPWACWRAQKQASGSVLLFVDADVVVAKETVRRTLEAMQQRHLGLLSLWGTWTLHSFWEQVAQPVVGGFVRGTHPLEAMNDPEQDAVFANGQFIMTTREAYEAFGGHEAVKAEVLEDVRLAQVARAAGVTSGMFVAPELFSVRLYDSLSTLWSGSVKNFYHGMKQKLGVAVAAVVFISLTALVPPAALVAGIAAGDPTVTAVAAFLVVQMHAFRAIQDHDAKRPRIWVLTHLLGVGVLLSIIVTSALRGMTGKATSWKGRPV